MEAAGSVKLVEPSPEWREPYLAFYEEWKRSGEDMVPWVIEKDPGDFPAMLQFLRNHATGAGLPEGWVPDSTFWLADGEGRIVGAVNIRHSLNEKLLCSGGHIGYGIRPSERRKGYGARLLGLSLEKARELGIRRALVVCDADNAASERTIVNNGGVRDADFTEEGGNVIRRFWIEV